jgi:hypothetical protein
LNDPLTKVYYRYLIPDPSSGRHIVAPYVSYSLIRHAPQISATYGKGYAIHTRPLRATAVDYLTPVITPEQLVLLDINAPFADAVNHIVSEYFPLDLAAAVRQYQYYKETHYAIQRSIKNLQEKEMRYIERAVGVLSDLENANVLGRLLAHNPIIQDQLLSMDPADPYNYQAMARYAPLAGSFQGDITQSALDTNINKHATIHYGQKRTGYAITPRRGRADRRRIETATERKRREEEEFFDSKFEEVENRLRDRLHTNPKHHHTNLRCHAHANHRCHKCKQLGHIRATCPRRSKPSRK